MDWEEFCSGKPRKKRAIGLLASRILEKLPDFPKDGERWEMTIQQVMKKFDARRGSVYEVFHVFEALLLVSKVIFGYIEFLFAQVSPEFWLILALFSDWS